MVDSLSYKELKERILKGAIQILKLDEPEIREEETAWEIADAAVDLARNILEKERREKEAK